MDIQALRTQREGLYNEAKSLLEEWKPENQAKYDEINVEIDNVDKQIDNIQKFLNREVKDKVGKHLDNVAGKGDNELVLNAYAKYVLDGKSALNADELSILNAQTKGTGSEGGFTVPKILIPEITSALKAFGGLRQVCKVITTDEGRTYDYVLSDVTGEQGELIGENTTAASLDTAFTTIPFATYKFSSKAFSITNDLAQDSAMDIVNHVITTALRRINLTQSGYFATGTGTAQPQGIVTAATQGVVGVTGSTVKLAPTDAAAYQVLVDLIASVDPAYRMSPSCAFVMNDTTWSMIQKLVDSTGRRLVVGDDVALSDAVVPKLLGYPVYICQEIASPAANAKSILFGDMSKFVIRDVNYNPLRVYTDSVYDSKDARGYLMFARAGSLYTAVGGAIKFFQHSAS